MTGQLRTQPHLLRIVLDILLFVVAIAGPWWLTLPLAIACMLLLGMYEVVVAGTLMDMINPTFFHSWSLGSLGFTAILLSALTGAMVVRKLLR